MSRNNQDRLGSPADQPDISPAIQNAVAGTSTPLSFVTPTEFVDLPSKGRFYPPGHTLHNQECVEIKFMTAKEEDILADKTLLKKGLAIDRLLSNIIVESSIDPNSLLVGDRNAILISCRVNGYGNEYNTKLICPVCFSHGRHEFDLNEAKMESGHSQDGVQITEGGTLIMTTPRLRADVECRMLTGADEKKMLKVTERDKKLKLPERALTNQLRTLIVSVNGQTDSSLIDSFIDACPASDSKFIRDTYQNCVPNIELKGEYVCGECGASNEVDVPFTTDFFWPQ